MQNCVFINLHHTHVRRRVIVDAVCVSKVCGPCTTALLFGQHMLLVLRFEIEQKVSNRGLFYSGLSIVDCSVY